MAQTPWLTVDSERDSEIACMFNLGLAEMVKNVALDTSLF